MLAYAAEIAGALVAVILLWILPAIGVAKLAESKGRSFGLWLAFTLIFSWVWFLIAALVIQPYDETRAA
jgi:hypothetical protein